MNTTLEHEGKRSAFDWIVKHRCRFPAPSDMHGSLESASYYRGVDYSQFNTERIVYVQFESKTDEKTRFSFRVIKGFFLKRK